MDTIEVQLISSLIKSLVSSTSDYEMIYKSLIRLPQTQVITNYFINYFSKTQEIETKKKIILLYFRYVEVKKDQISNLNGSLLFDHFKHIICETPLLNLIDDYIRFSSTLTFYIQNLKTFSDSSLYQSIIDWSNDNTAIALFSLSEVHNNYFGRCISNVISNYNEKIPTIVAISLLLSKHKIDSIDQTASDFFNEKNVPSIIHDSIQYCFTQDDSNTEFKRIGFFLLQSILHFLKDTDSRQFYIDLSETIFSVFEKSDASIQKVALSAFCELPPIDDDDSFSITKQLSTVISAFGERITDYDSDLANQLIEFTAKRMKNRENLQVRKIIEPLFQSNEHFNGAALLSCRFDLVGEFQRYIFSENVANSNQALSACYSIEYLNSHEKLNEDFCSNVIKTFLSAASLTNDKENGQFENEISHVFEILIQKVSFEKFVNSMFENILLLLNSSIIDKIIDIFMKYCKEKSNSFQSIQKVTNEAFVVRIFPYMMKFSISPVETQNYISYLFILIFLCAMRTGVLKAICELIDSPLSFAFEELIPTDCSSDIYAKALSVYNSNTEEKESSENGTKLDNLNNLNLTTSEVISASSLIIISLQIQDDDEMQTNVARSFISKESFNELLFERFFASITYRKSDESIEFFTSLVSSTENEESTSITSFFLRKSTFLKSFFPQSTGVSGKFSKQTIMNTLSYISSLEMSSSSVSKLFSIFFTTCESNPKSRSVLLALCKHHKKCQLSDKLIQFVISSEYFVEVIPDFFYAIDQLNDSIIQKAFKTYFDFGDENSFDAFCKSAFENYQGGDCFSALASSLLQVRDVYKMMRFGICLVKYDSNNSEHVPKLTIQFAMNILSNDDQLRILCQTGLFILYLLKTHRTKEANEEEFKAQEFESTIQITSLPFNESVLKCTEFFDEIAETDLFKKYANSIIDLICEMTPIELPIMVLSLSICRKHLETQSFVLHLAKQGNISVNNALVRHLVMQSMTAIIDHDFAKFIQYFIASNLSNQFVLDFISMQVRLSEKHRESFIKFAFKQFLTDTSTYMSDTDVEKGKFQLFLAICRSNTYKTNNECGDVTNYDLNCKKDDFLLIWLASIIFVNLNRSSKQISLIVRRDCRIGLSESLRAIFARLNYECPPIEDRDISLAETFSKKIAQFVFALSLSDISSFIASLNDIELRKGHCTDITVVIIFILSDLLKQFIQIRKSGKTASTENKNNEDKNAENSKENKSTENKNNVDKNTENSKENKSTENQNNADKNTENSKENENVNNDTVECNKNESDSDVARFISVLTDRIHSLCMTLKDDACRVISAKFASLFTVSNLRLFTDDGRRNLLVVSLRSLIMPDEATQSSCLIFLSMILAVSPSDAIKKNKAKLLDSITRCFDLKKFVGIEILLDSIQSIITIDSDIEPFNNMGLISIPWFLILSVNENEAIRKKSIQILIDLSGKNKNSMCSEKADEFNEIVKGFFEKLGADEMIVFGNFLIDWSMKNGFNQFSLRLIYHFAVAIKKSNEKLASMFLNKTMPALISIVNDSNSQLQASAIEILSVLME